MSDPSAVASPNKVTTWGYMMALEEIEEQATAMGIDFTDITMVRLQQMSLKLSNPSAIAVDVRYQCSGFPLD
jgi:hypothetical protein